MFSRSALILLAMLPIATLADYNTGLGAYSRKNFAVAQLEFLQVARLADAGAQKALAQMYARGEGSAVDLIEAYAWASVAADQGDAAAAKIRDAIAAGLTPALKAQAETRRKSYQEKYSLEAFNRDWQPQLTDAQPLSYDLRFASAQASVIEPVKYPERAKSNGSQGAFCVSFYVNRDGVPVSIRPELADGSDLLLHAVETSVAAWQFKPDPNERRNQYCVEFLLAGDGTWLSDERLQAMLGKARSGDARSLLDVARDLAKLQHVTTDRVGPAMITKAWLAAAKAGSAEAQFELSSRLLRGDGCTANRDKALRWLWLAVEQGYEPAQRSAALALNNEPHAPITTTQKLTWLDIAAKNGDTDASLELAKQLLRTRTEQNISTALDLLSKLPPEQHIHVLDWLAYGHALSGDFSAAQDEADDALDLATDLGLAIEIRQAALTAVEAEQLPPVPAH